MSIINYPFYCIGRIDTIEAATFIRDQVKVAYGWTLNRENHGNSLSPAFFATKMHVFTIIVNKGFEI